MSIPKIPRFTSLSISLSAFLCGAVCPGVAGQPFYDNFQRSNTSATTTGTIIGPSYTISSPLLAANNGGTASWQINSNKVTVSPGSIAHNTLISNAVKIRNELDVGFTASCDLSSANAGFMGLALNYQGPDDFYAIRIKPSSATIQLCYIQTTVDRFSDYFNRTNTSLTTTGSVIGSGYAITTPALSGNSGTASWKINGNRLTSAPGANVGNTIVYNTIATKNTDGFGCNVAATMTTASNGAFMGVVLNYQDKDDYYAVRITPGSSTIQLIYVQNSGGSVTTSVVDSDSAMHHKSTLGDVNLTVATGNTYYMRVASSSAGIFTYTVTDRTTNLTAAGTLEDTSHRFADGVGGIYSSLAAADFDDLVVASSTVATDVIDSETLTALAGSTLTITAGNNYTLTVTSSSVGQFTYVLQDQTTSTIAQGSLADTESRFRGGYCGLYATLAAADFMSLAVTQSDNNLIDNFNRTDTSATTTGSVIGTGYVITTPTLTGNSGTSSWQIGSTTTNAGSFVVGRYYMIKAIGTTDFTLIGAASNVAGTFFKATGVGSGTGTATDSQYLVSSPGSNSSNTIVNLDAYVLSGGSKCFTVSGNFNSASAAYMGMVANYTDRNNFYAVRIMPTTSSIQLIYVQEVSGTVSTGTCASQTLTTAASATMSVATNTNYTLSITSDTIGVFNYVLTDGTNTARGTLTDSSARFSGGMAGFYASSAAASYDNLSITTNNIVFTDDFARAATGTTTSGAAIWPGYCITTPGLSGSSGTAAWQIAGNLLSVTPTSSTSSSTLVRIAVAEAPINGEDYIVSGNVIPPGGGWAGMVLNYQNANNYYAVRVQGGTSNLQLIYVQQSGGSTTLALAQGVTLPFTVTGGTNVELTLAATGPGSFAYTIQQGSNVATGTLADASHRFAGGFTGYYAGSAATSSFGALTLVTSRQKVATQFLFDRTLQAGLTAMDVYSKPVLTAGPLRWTTSNGSPLWTFAEYNFVASLYPGTPTSQGDGSYLWQVSFTAPSSTYYPLVKTLSLAPTGSTAASSYDFKVRVNSNADFDGIFKTSTQPWPAAYVSQRIAAPGGTLNSENPTLADLKKLELSVTAAIPVQNVSYATGYNSTQHVAHFLLFVTIQNLNPNSPGYGDYLWFGIQLYNDHVDPTTLVTLVDTGTGKYIYNVGVAPFVATNVGSGGSTASKTVSGDILPLVKHALQHVWNAGYLSASKDFADYQIGSYSIAWEVTGLADVEAAVKSQSLIGTW